ncbi:T-lymphocyte surface antigen Ly-9-like [Anarhichas minor]|uniref:T-lymphocyte surface antigen Ly-9-like n=1 Tax=Anarhichas minor TaxID=65739 RepID=UPI003F733A2E
MFSGSSLNFPSSMSKMCPRETSRRLAGCLCVLLAVVSVNSEVVSHRKVGDKAVLRPDISVVTGPITSINWKQNGNIAADWEGSATDYYRQFKVRSSLNTKNGELTITGLSPTDNGLYTSEINSEKMTPDLRLIVIHPVPKPTVSISYDDEKTSCNLTCDGNTTGAEPVTCRWRPGDDAWTKSRELHITKTGSSGVKEFSCELQNPVSEESSLPIHNPLYTAPVGDLNIVTGVVMFIALLLALLLLAGVHRCKTGMWFFQKTSMPWDSNFWRKDERPSTAAAEPNGPPLKEKERTDEAAPLSK